MIINPLFLKKKDNEIKCLENEIENQNKLIKRQETEIETLKKQEQLVKTTATPPARPNIPSTGIIVKDGI